MIPEAYVPDLQLRLASTAASPTLETRREIERFGAELIDRFGPLPEEVEHLLRSSPSRRCAAGPMSRSSTPGRRA